MATTVSFNGTNYSIPAVGERLWGTNVRNFLIAVAGNALSKNGGSFTLTQETDFGNTYGLVVKYLKSKSSNISTTGVLRLANNEGIGFRTAANSADLILKVNASDRLEFNSVAIPTISSTDTFTNKTINGPDNTLTNIAASSLASTTGSGAVVLASGATLTSPAITTPTGIVKGDVGLGNVDNTSDATKNSATATLTNKTLLTPVIDDYLELNEESAPSTPSSGKVRVYAKTDKKIYTKDSAGTELQVGASGSGEINALTTGSQDATGWSNGTSHTAATDTSNSPLSPVITTSISAISSAAIALVSETSTSGIYKTFTLPTGLENKKLKVEFYFTSPAATDGTWALSVYNNTTRVPLSTDSSGDTILPSGVTGKFTAYFDTDSANNYSVNLVQRTRTNANTLYITSVIVGPGIQPQGAVVSTQDVTFTGSWVSNTTYTATETRVGEWAEYYVKVALSGAPTATNLTLTLPAGRSINTNILQTTAESGNRIPFSVVGINDTGVAGYQGMVMYSSSTVVQPRVLDASGTYAGSASISNVQPHTFGAGDFITISFKVPIAEWADSGNQNLAQNEVEYAYNTDTSSTGINTTSFGYGPTGQSLASVAWSLGSYYIRRVRFKTPIQVGDKIDIEVGGTTGRFLDIESRLGSYHVQNGKQYGVFYEIVNDTDVDVLFGDGGYGNPSTFGGNGSAWGVALNWRVRKSSAGSAVGFGLATETTSGLVKLPGSARLLLADGSNPATTSTSVVDVPGVTLNITINKSARIGFAFTTSVRNSTAGAVTFLNIQVNGVNQFGAQGIYHNQDTNNYFQAVNLTGISEVLGPGTYTVKARFYVSSGGVTLLADSNNSTMLSAWEI